MADPRSRRLLVERLTWIGLGLSVAAILLALIAAFGSGQGWWHFRPAFFALRIAFFAALAGGLLALVALLIRTRGRRRRVTMAGIAALLLAAGFSGYIGWQARTARALPPIHDITTNLENVPEFYRLRVRTDNFDIVPHMGRQDLHPLAPEDRWKVIHREAYPDLRTIHVPWPPAQTIQRAADLARARGWEFATISPDAGVLEATDTSRFFRFKDDIVVRARRAPQGGSLVDMRSISRVGVSDIGVNARRIRSFLADLREGAPQRPA
ncbi:MAG TPA: DUF1499 domain-containing protein [Allosphingosinicella sp.]